MKNKYLTLVALSGFFCVALGAFAAHGLKNILDVKALSWIDTGLEYQMFHIIAVLAVALSALRDNQFARLSMSSWLIGILLFSGSLYALAFEASNVIVWITPIGGTLFLIGWISLAYGSFKSKSL
ncbi:TPA: DUF423 domain-containing protein [Haemophilus influenzae]|uniref:DUF423 domain-containing protein n=1 Tax=Haemophilus influenzae TaxID=727 RepID=UPI0001545759|nr:DUF423 domain-containing protein [Haemophilus influenzae]ABQ98685.1 CTP synthetase [Haemophilus influenzae PittEE]AVI96241.1 hypothetical protein BV083_1203 [Haemophilus influenzae]AVI98013.1 hypothetical protein BV085_1200 [Haemophilus influenzae]AVJ03441.1 hypothetical protein BV131_1152 [Haemophilus influenzae]AVJ05183.1 hypothetical protein BV134_1153 [Haemophilus influenzae]